MPRLIIYFSAPCCKFNFSSILSRRTLVSLIDLLIAESVFFIDHISLRALLCATPVTTARVDSFCLIHFSPL